MKRVDSNSSGICEHKQMETPKKRPPTQAELSAHYREIQEKGREAKEYRQWVCNQVISGIAFVALSAGTAYLLNNL